jgi:hypothetical protein
LFGSAWDCSSCNEARESLKLAHPNHPARTEAGEKMWSAFMDALHHRAAMPPGVESLDARRSIHEGASGMVEHMFPFRHVEPTEDELRLAATLGDAFIGTAMRESEFAEEVAQNKTWDTTLHLFEFVEGLVLAIRRHGGDATAVVREWTLMFDDRPPWSRAWIRVSVPRRMLLVRGWEATAKEALPRDSDAGKVQGGYFRA